MFFIVISNCVIIVIINIYYQRIIYYATSVSLYTLYILTKTILNTIASLRD